MDSMLFILAIVLFIWLIVLFIWLIIYAVRHRKSAGEVGESAVSHRLNRLPKKEYFIINDFMFRKANGNTTQIDHLVVSPYGIFVIETKNIYGYIHGSDNSQLWRSNWRNRDLSFDNPILQNEAHIRALREQIHNEKVQYISIIAFSTNAELQVSVNDTYVVYWSEVKRLIQRYKVPIMTTEEAHEIYTYLLSLNIIDKDIRQSHASIAQHNKNIYQQKQEEAIENGRCPVGFLF